MLNAVGVFESSPILARTSPPEPIVSQAVRKSTIETRRMKSAAANSSSYRSAATFSTTSAGDMWAPWCGTSWVVTKCPKGTTQQRPTAPTGPSARPDASQATADLKVVLVGVSLIPLLGLALGRINIFDCKFKGAGQRADGYTLRQNEDPTD